MTVEGDQLVFTGLSLLGGRVTADRLAIPVNGFGDAAVSGLRVEGRKPQGLPNQVIPLKDGGYVVSLQESLDGRQRKLAGLFVHLGAKTGRLPAGTELLVGVPAEVNSGVGYTYPLGQPGEIIGCPFVPGSTHSAFVAPDNLASDNAVDIAVPLGTPVLAVTAGVIGPQIGPLDSMDPRMAGLRVHLKGTRCPVLLRAPLGDRRHPRPVRPGRTTTRALGLRKRRRPPPFCPGRRVSGRDSGRARRLPVLTSRTASPGASSPASLRFSRAGVERLRVAIAGEPPRRWSRS